MLEVSCQPELFSDAQATRPLLDPRLSLGLYFPNPGYCQVLAVAKGPRFCAARTREADALGTRQERRNRDSSNRGGVGPVRATSQWAAFRIFAWEISKGGGCRPRKNYGWDV